MEVYLSANLYFHKPLMLKLGVRNVDRNNVIFVSDHITKPALYLKSQAFKLEKKKPQKATWGLLEGYV